jgi:hypothetical protein
LAVVRRRPTIRPKRPRPSNDKVAGSGVATAPGVRLTLSRSAPMFPGVLLVKTSGTMVVVPTVNVVLTIPSVTSPLERVKVWLKKEPNVTVVDVVLPRCDPMRSKLRL